MMQRKKFQKISVRGTFRMSLSGVVKPLTEEKTREMLEASLIELESRFNGVSINGFKVSFEMQGDLPEHGTIVDTITRIAKLRKAK